MRSVKAIAGAAVSTAALTLLAACAGSDGGGQDQVDVGAPEQQKPKTELTVTVTPEPGAEPKKARLTCEPNGGDHPRAQAACTKLTNLSAKAFKKPDPDQMCTQQFGGPEKATVTGTLKGEQVDASFSRTNGCEITRWQNMGPVLQLS
ncbi:MAG: hypothetical protein GEV11_06495 [Streptosporangiales bacterium]|nr:hypothetical protein [Streptosporangiales bacterium]